MSIFDLLQRGDQKAAVALVRRQPKTVREHNAKGSSLLMGAAYFELPQVVEAALAAGADVNEARRLDGMTALHFAVGTGNAKIVARLLRAGAAPDAETKKAETPIATARKLSLPKIVALLLDAGADKTARGLVLEAAANGDLRRVRKLLDGGRSVDEKNNAGETPLLCAARGAHLPVVELLLERGADVNHRDRKKNTALSNAQLAAHPALVATLLRNGADPRIRPPRMVALKDWAKAYRATEVLTELARRGIVKSSPRRNETPLETLSFDETRRFLSARKVKLFPALNRFEGRALVYRGDLELRSLRLDHGEYVDGAGTPIMGPGIIVDGSLRVGVIENGEQDFGPFLIVLGDLDVGSAAVGGAELNILGDLSVRNAFHGYYNHGSINVVGDVKAALFIADDYSARFGGDVHGTILASYGRVRGAVPKEPQLDAVLAPRFWKRDGEHKTLAGKAIFEALSKGKPISRGTGK